MIGWLVGALAAAGAGAQDNSRPEVTGGVGVATAPGIQLYGAIVGHGLVGAGVSSTSTFRLTNGLLPTVGPSLIRRNMADPIWLEMSAGQADPTPTVQLAAWRQTGPAAPGAPLEMTGWQL